MLEEAGEAEAGGEVGFVVNQFAAIAVRVVTVGFEIGDRGKAPVIADAFEEQEGVPYALPSVAERGSGAGVGEPDIAVRFPDFVEIQGVEVRPAGELALDLGLERQVAVFADQLVERVRLRRVKECGEPFRLAEEDGLLEFIEDAPEGIDHGGHFRTGCIGTVLGHAARQSEQQYRKGGEKRESSHGRNPPCKDVIGAADGGT